MSAESEREQKMLEAVDALTKASKANAEKLGNQIEQALVEVKKLDTVTGATSQKLTELGTQAAKTNTDIAELKQQVLDLEQKGISPAGGDPSGGDTPGAIVIKSAQYALAQKTPGARNMEPVQVAGFFQKAVIVNATGQNQPLVPAQRMPGIITAGERRMTVRNLLPNFRTASNIIEYVTETFTNNAGPQGGGSSPIETEAQVKPESAMTFTLAYKPIITLAHWIPASRQVLSDAPMLQSHIDHRLRYGLMLEEEDQILNGADTGGNLNGLLNQATAYNGGATGDQRLDTLLKAIRQVSSSEYIADGFLLSNVDWIEILLLKDSEGRYLFGNPAAMTQNGTIWGLPVVATNAVTTGTFVCAAWQLAAQLWDREDATVRIAEQHSDFFVKNLVAILAEERLGLTVTRATAVVKGTF